MVNSDGYRGGCTGSGGRPDHTFVRRRRVPALRRSWLSASSLACRATRFAMTSGGRIGPGDGVRGGSPGDAAGSSCPFRSANSPNASLLRFCLLSLPFPFRLGSRSSRLWSFRSLVSSRSLTSHPSPRRIASICLFDVLASHSSRILAARSSPRWAGWCLAGKPHSLKRH